jgi:hypothetical protein
MPEHPTRWQMPKICRPDRSESKRLKAGQLRIAADMKNLLTAKESTE